MYLFKKSESDSPSTVSDTDGLHTKTVNILGIGYGDVL